MKFPTQLYGDSFISHCKDPYIYKPIRISWNVNKVLNVAHFPLMFLVLTFERLSWGYAIQAEGDLCHYPLPLGQDNGAMLLKSPVSFFKGENITRWWFQIFFIFTPTWGRFPI